MAHRQFDSLEKIITNGLNAEADKLFRVSNAESRDPKESPRLFTSWRNDLPSEPLVRWAAFFFTLTASTLLISVAASQVFLSLAAVCYAAHLIRKPSVPAFPPIKLPLALFAAATIIPIFFSENPWASGFAIKKFVLFLILLLGVNLFWTERRLVFALKAVFVEAAVAGAWSVVEFIRQEQQVSLLYPGRFYRMMTLRRITGFLSNWMTFGGQQMLAFTALLAFLLFSLYPRSKNGDSSLASSKHPDRNASDATVNSGAPHSGAANFLPANSAHNRHAILWAGVAAVVALSILLNFTRSVWLGCFVALIYLLARWRARWLLVLPIAVAAVIITSPKLVRERVGSVLNPHAHTSEAQRLEMWGVGLRMIRKHPLVGVGPGNIPEMYQLYMPPGKTPIRGWHDHLHNDYIQLAAERGLPCLAAWLWMMIALGVCDWRLAKKLKRLGWVAHASFAAWIAFMIQGFFEFNFSSTPPVTVFLFLAALPFAAQRIEALSEESRHGRTPA